MSLFKRALLREQHRYETELAETRRRSRWVAEPEEPRENEEDLESPDER